MIAPRYKSLNGHNREDCGLSVQLWIQVCLMQSRGWRMSTNCLLSGRSREGQGPNCQGNQRTGDRKSLILTPPLLDRRLAPPARSCLAFSLTSYFTQGLEFSSCTQPFFSFLSLQQNVFNFGPTENQIVQMSSTPDDGGDVCRDSHFKGGGGISRYYLECLFQ